MFTSLLQSTLSGTKHLDFLPFHLGSHVLYNIYIFISELILRTLTSVEHIERCLMLSKKEMNVNIWDG